MNNLNEKKTVKIGIVVDYQTDFITGPLGTDEAVAIAPKINEFIKSDLDYLCVTMDTHDNNYLDTLEGKKLPVTHCIRNSDGWAVPADTFSVIAYEWGTKLDKFRVFIKNTFCSMELVNHVKYLVEKELNEDEIAEVLLVGVCTDICVLANAVAIRATLPNTKIVVYENCCAGVTPELHEAALKVLGSQQVDIETL